MEKISGKSPLKNNVQLNKINKYIDDLEEKISEAPGLMGFGFMRQDDLIVILSKIRNELPAELNNATDIVSRKDSIANEANQKAQDILDSAERKANEIVEAGQREAERLVGETYVMKKANQEANNAIMDAQNQAKSAIAYANNYVAGAFDSILKGIEYLQNDTEKAKMQIVSSLQSSEQRYSVADDRNYQYQSNGYQEDDEDLGDYDGYDE